MPRSSSARPLSALRAISRDIWALIPLLGQATAQPRSNSHSSPWELEKVTRSSCPRIRSSPRPRPCHTWAPGRYWWMCARTRGTSTRLHSLGPRQHAREPSSRFISTVSPRISTPSLNSPNREASRFSRTPAKRTERRIAASALGPSARPHASPSIQERTLVPTEKRALSLRTTRTWRRECGDCAITASHGAITTPRSATTPGWKESKEPFLE